MGAPGGRNSKPESYAAVLEMADDETFSQESIVSEGADENAVLVTGGALTLEQSNIVRISADSTGGDQSSFYGVGAAVLTTGGQVNITDCIIDTDAAGGAGVFAYGDGVAYVKDTQITTRQNTSGGIHVAGGGTLLAENLTVYTYGESSAAVRSDRGSGVMLVDGGSYCSAGLGSPAVYVTADITIRNADLTATGSEALCLEGLNTVRLYDCNLSGAMLDLQQNDHTWTVILYQSMSGDAAVGKGHFEMVGGTLTSTNGGLFYTTNTESEFILSGVEIQAAEDSEYFLQCTGNENARGWGQRGNNGAQCTFTAIGQRMPGDVIWDSISTLDLYLTAGSTWTGAAIQDESYAGNGGSGYAVVNIDASSTWVVTANSTVSQLHCAGSVVDDQGWNVTILAQDGTVLRQGESDVTVICATYDEVCDASGAGIPSSWDAQTI